MNKLFPIELASQGTSDVESFASYLYRSAYEHGVYVGQLLGYIYESANEYHGDFKIKGSLAKHIPVPVLIRPGNSAKKVLFIIEALTSKDLYEGTLGFIDENVSKIVNEIAEVFRWCPECFSKMEKSGEEPYFKLIWHLNTIKACHIHGAPLIDACEKCGRDQNTYRRKRPINYCQYCGHQLSLRKNKLEPMHVVPSWQRNCDDVLQLIYDISVVNRESFNSQGISGSIKFLIENDCGEKLKALIRVSEEPWMAWLSLEKVPYSLLTMRRLAHVIGVSLYDLITGNICYAYLDNDWLDIGIQPDFMSVSKKKYIDHEKIYEKIKSYLSEQKHPPSLRKLAMSVGVSVGYIDYRYKSLARKVVNDHVTYHEELMVKKKYQAQKVALEFFVDEKYEEYPKSRKQAYKVLRAETGLPKFILKKAIQNAYDALS